MTQSAPTPSVAQSRVSSSVVPSVPTANTQTNTAQVDTQLNPQEAQQVADQLSSQAEAQLSEVEKEEQKPAAPTQQNSPQAIQQNATQQSTSQISPLQPKKSAVEPEEIQVTSLLEALVKQGSLTPEEAEQISAEQLSTGIDTEQLLTDKKIVAEKELIQAKAAYYNVPFIDLTQTGISPEALNVLPESVARRYQMLPFALDEEANVLQVAMANPLDVTAIDFAQQKTGYRLEAYYGTPSQVEQKIAERYAQSLSGEVTRALEETDQVEKVQAEEEAADLSQGVVRQAPITKIVETILSFAIKARASDVHIEPEQQRTRIRYRIDGILQEKLILPQSVHDAVVSRIKILSQLKIDEKRVPQDGRFSFESEGKAIDLRVSTMPTTHGEKVVMRLLKKNMKVPSLEELGLSGLALSRLRQAIRDPNGIILITGPTGSGKTTTLYSTLHILNSTKVNIMTLEDPVEYQMSGVNQVQVNPQAGLNFANGLRSFLRQDPDVIMVGEIRDSETVGLAIQASLTGHLVFSTLHTNSAAGALPRLIDMGGENFLLASSMKLVMGQRVVRRINPDYKEAYQPEPEVLADIKEVLGDHFSRWCQTHNQDPNKLTLYRPKESRPQAEPAYKGRIGIFEVMLVNEELSKMILKNASDDELERYSLQNGMLLMKQDGYLKVLEGITSIEEVLRVAEV